MEAIRNGFSRAVNYLTTIGVADLVDIIIVAYLIYMAIWFVRRTNSYNLAKGLIVIIVALGLSGLFKLTMINFLLRKTVELGLIALLILFQPEIRRVLERMGRSFSSSRRTASPVMDTSITQTVQACREMSASRTGALIIFERGVKLNSIMNTGTMINADVTAELLKNLFFNKAPLHDGAVIIKDSRVAAAGCVLPLTQSTNLSKELGMRHRAGIGLSEQSDAIVVIVSEETGAISVAVEGTLKRHLEAETLNRLLHSELVEDEEKESKKDVILNSLKRLFKVKNDEKDKPDEKVN